MHTVDKFGRFKSFHGGRVGTTRGPPGLGFILDRDGNYDMQNRRLTNVADGVEPNDCVTVKHLAILTEGVDNNAEVFTEHLSGLADTLNAGFEKFAKDRMIPKIQELQTAGFKKFIEEEEPVLTKKVSDEIQKDVAQKLHEIILKYTDNVIKPWVKAEIKANDKNLEKIQAIERDITKIRDEIKTEFKAVTDITRDFVYRVTSPGYARNSKEKEAGIRKKLKESHTTWRDAFPEISS